MPGGAEHRRGRGRVVSPRRAGHPAVTGSGHDGARLLGRCHGLGVVFGVPAVAQDGVVESRRADELLCCLVLGRQDQFGGVRGQDGCVGDEPDAGGPGRVDDVAVLRHPGAHLASGNQQEPVNARERSLESRGIGIVRDAHLDATCNQLPGFRGVAHDGHQRVRFLAGEQFIEDQPAQLSCRTRYCNRHVALLISGQATSRYGWPAIRRWRE
ncbi:hypothetical protein SRABI128_06365 [Microbacterium sp. Bi128]|nr:hypothetical protein SRABI128_06365 [Microbacterium sp. Bi128]